MAALQLLDVQTEHAATVAPYRVDMTPFPCSDPLPPSGFGAGSAGAGALRGFGEGHGVGRGGPRRHAGRAPHALRPVDKAAAAARNLEAQLAEMRAVCSALAKAKADAEVKADKGPEIKVPPMTPLAFNCAGNSCLRASSCRPPACAKVMAALKGVAQGRGEGRRGEGRGPRHPRRAR